MRLLLAFLLPLAVCGQDWQACSVWSYPAAVTNIDGVVAMPVPNPYSAHTPLVSFLTTTNAPGLMGNLRGATITATAQLVTVGNPVLRYGNDCGNGGCANMRLYFTTTQEPYVLAHANAQETQYWWADYAEACISSGGNYSPVVPGTYTLTAKLDPALWSDSQGHFASDSNYTAAFIQAASRVAQIGLSFGGGCFFDTGVGVYNINDPQDSATLLLLDYAVERPKPIARKKIVRAEWNTE